MKQPNHLMAGDKIAIVAPAKRILYGELDEGIALIKEWGFEPILSPNMYKEHNFGYAYAGTDEERLSDFQWALDHSEIKAIWCARGGYGSVKIIDDLDFTAFLANPKWIIGYSDITVFHAHLSRLGIQSLHGVTLKKLAAVDYHADSYGSMYKGLTGNEMEYQLASHSLNNIGLATGELIGGNLSMICSLVGSSSAIDVQGKILVLEDWFENWYAVDRMLMNLKRNGFFDKISGLILGSFTHMDTENENLAHYNHPFDPMTYSIIHTFTQHLKVPVAFQFPCGHIGHHLTLKMGAKVHLNVSANSVNLQQIQ